MSIYPFLIACIINFFVLLLSNSPSLVAYFLVCLILAAIYLCYYLLRIDAFVNNFCNILGLYLILFGELLFFLSIVYGCCVYDHSEGYVGRLGNVYSFGGLGSFFLFCSYLYITVWDYYAGTSFGRFCWSNSLLFGYCFLAVEIYEFHYCCCNFGDSYRISFSFFLLFVHLMHLLVGLVLLDIGRIHMDNNHYLQNDKYLRYTSLYWHFVDIMWFFVFFAVYYL